VNVRQLKGITGDVDSLKRNAYSGIASAIALQMPSVHVPGKTVLRGGVGYFRGQTAVGLSMRSTSDNGRYSVTAGVAGGRGGIAAGAGLEITIN
jgi:trimeric autotransporter adhesin